MRLKKEYALGVLVVGIVLMYFLITTTEGFATPTPTPLLSSVPGGTTASIYILMPNEKTFKIVAPKKVHEMIDFSKTKMMDEPKNFNMLLITLKGNYTVHDFVLSGFGTNNCTSTTKNKDGKCWGLGDVDAGATLPSLSTLDNKIHNRSITKTGLSKLPKALTTFKIGPIGAGAFGGMTTMVVTGDPAMDGGKASGPANVRIDLLLTN